MSAARLVNEACEVSDMSRISDEASEVREVRIENCDTVVALFLKRATEDAKRIALREKDLGVWNPITWGEYGEIAREVGLGLMALGMAPGDVCSIASEVRREWLFADLGIICAGGVTNGVYPTDSPSQVEYLINDSGTRFYFAEDEEQLDKVLEVRARTPSLAYTIIIDMEGLRDLDDPGCLSFEDLLALGRAAAGERGEEWRGRADAIKPDDLMILTYTSGTTGPPKGAMINQRNMLFQMQILQDIYEVEGADEQVGFLPLSHVAGRMFYTFLPIASRSVVNLIENAETFAEDLREVAPSIHFAVPRVWEKQYSTVSIKLKDATRLGQLAYAWALELGHKVSAYRLRSESPPLMLKALHWLVDRALLKNVRQLLGIDKARWLSTAAAPIAPDLIRWFWALGRPMYEVYGQTECSGLATANLARDCRIGSVGKACRGVEVVLSERGEILIRGPGIIKGYWNRPEKTAETIVDGWLHTGDAGRIDDDGYVYIVDRMKDIIITAGGHNVTPSEIENQLKFSPYVSDAVVVGDKRPYLTALVMIDQENVTKYAQDLSVPFTNYTSLCHTSEVEALIGGEIERVNTQFARVETIKKFRLIDQLLDAEDEELTPTMKLKRKVVNEKYADLINEMYGG